MKFKVKQDSPTFTAIMEMMKEINAVNKVAKDLFKETHAITYTPLGGKLAGGISAFIFPKRPKGYKPVGPKERNLSYPNFSNRGMLKKINDLPVLEYSVLNDIIGFQAPQHLEREEPTIKIVYSPGVIVRNDEILIDITEGCFYDGHPDLVEILESEFLEIKNAPKM